ncbi:MAG TPA: efflux RND transporter permease subunit [Thermoanaerobaculia bacterium]|nr:efflux RND transporter permease subunit [Thermoanaerobaculia bacterium]
MIRPPSLRRLLGRLATLAVRRPGLVIALAVAPSAALGIAAVRAPIDLSFTGILDRSDPEVERYFRAARRFGLGGSLLVLVEGDESQLARASAAVVAALAARPEIASVEPPADPSWWRDRAPWLVDDAAFEDWLSLARGAPDPAAGLRLAGVLERLAPRAPPGARLVEARLREDPLDSLVGDWPFLDIERGVREAVAAATPEVAVSFSGLAAIAAQDQARTLGAIRRLTPLSLLLVLLLFRTVERRPLGLLAVAAPLVCAVAATLGVVGLVAGELTLMETFFGVTVFGLGIDFAIHLLVRLREERARAASFGGALHATLEGAGRGVVSGGVTTAGAFLIAALAPDPVARHLGLAGGIGLLCSLLLMLTLLPALWSLLEQRSPRARAAGGGLRVASRPLVTLARSAAARPRATLSATALLVALALAGTPRLHFETDLARVFNREVPAVATVERVGQLFGLNGAPWIVTADGLEQARALAASFRASPGFSRVITAGDLIAAPERIARRAPRLAAAVPAARARLAALEARGDEPVDTAGAPPLPAGWSARQARGALRDALAALPAAAEAGPPTLDDLSASLRRKLVGRDGELLVLAYAEGSTLDAAGAREVRARAQAIAPDATSVSALLEAVMLGDRPWLLPVAGAIPVFVALVLLVDFRSLRLAALALVPVLSGAAVTLGVFGWTGMSFNVMTAIVLPLLVGLGVDDGIHVVHRIREHLDREEGNAIPDATAAVGRAIVLTTLTTCASFGALLLTDHPGLESMALVMLIGLPLCLLASLTALPAAAAVLLRD